MQTTNIRNLLHLYGKQVSKCLIMAMVLIMVMPKGAAFGQKKNKNKGKSPNRHLYSYNLPNYDQKKLQYGFLIGLHSSIYKLKYSDAFTQSSMFDQVQAINTRPGIGFALGFIGNLRISEFFDFRITPKVTFNEYGLDYVYVNDAMPEHFLMTSESVSNTMVEVPILFRLKSLRRGNSRMYLIGGFTPAFEASGKKDEEVVFETKKFNLSLEIGFGLEQYFELFKFAPELRFSFGVLDQLGANEDRNITKGMEKLTTNTVSLYLQFQ
ncbi:type IX secretion/gliding motility protein PorT/SprT [Aureibacter tunicatorum]|uniref:Outer membrane protein beta-barrel domain-containing protein n=1 Tax=Aureibacter tunicatorum TaxID=866807 RepID=A0AAE4BPN7_9BACT|nr:porin family protein [Aureibacter tunicatorum]MDR6238179.1 hypothetical protein [Aureibacter tunicatorum]BDD03212.1 hypothetical protein AUTU_06950 [Aureibacter tunicatorum]